MSVLRGANCSPRDPRDGGPIPDVALDTPPAPVFGCLATVMIRTIGDIAAFVTSKNAGPFLLTLDVVFPDAPSYERFKALGVLDRAAVARLYGIDPADVLAIIEFDPACAVKVTIRRPWSSGALGETDVYGAQQHVPLMQFPVEWEAG